MPCCRCREFLAHVRTTSDFTIQWSARPPPAASSTCRISVPVHLRQEFPQGSRSFGHLLRDNYDGLMRIAKAFGLTPAYFSWVTWPRTSRKRGAHLSHVHEKYSTWLSKHPTYAWTDLVSACKQGLFDSRAPPSSHAHLCGAPHLHDAPAFASPASATPASASCFVVIEPHSDAKIGPGTHCRADTMQASPH